MRNAWAHTDFDLGRSGHCLRHCWDVFWSHSLLTAKIIDIKRSDFFVPMSQGHGKNKDRSEDRKKKNTFALANISLHLRSKSIRLHLSLEATRPFISTWFHFHPFVCIHLSLGESRTPEALRGARPSLQPHPGKWQVVNVMKLLRVYVGESYRPVVMSNLCSSLWADLLYHLTPTGGDAEDFWWWRHVTMFVRGQNWMSQKQYRL